MEIPVRLIPKSNTIKSSLSLCNICSINNFSDNTFRSKPIPLFNNNTDRYLLYKTSPSNNLSQIKKFIKGGKMNRVPKNINLKFNNSNIVCAKNDLFYTRKKINQKSDSSPKYISFVSTQFIKTVLSGKNKNNDDYNDKNNSINKKYEILNSIHKLKRNILDNKNKSFIINSSDKNKTSFNFTKNDIFDNLIFKTKKKKKCLLKEINMLKNEFQNDIDKQYGKYELTYGENKNNDINYKIRNSYKNTKNYREELKNDNYFNMLSAKTSRGNKIRTHNLRSLLLNNFKY